MRTCALLSCSFRGGSARCLVGLKRGTVQPQFLKTLNWKLAKNTSSVAGTADTHQSTGGTKKDNATPDLSALRPLSPLVATVPTFFPG